MMLLCSPKPRKSICDACVLCSNASESITWNSSSVNVNSSLMRSTIYPIMYPRRAFDPARRTWKLWLNLPYLRHTLKSKPFWALQVITGNSSRDLHGWHNHCMNTYPEKVLARRTSEWHSLVMCRLPLRCLRKHVLRPLCWLLPTQDKTFLLETNVSKLVLGAVLSQKQSGGWYHPVAYVSCWSLPVHECNYHSTKQEFLALKVAVAEQFQNTCAGNWLLWKLTITHLPTFWLLPI